MSDLDSLSLARAEQEADEEFRAQQGRINEKVFDVVGYILILFGF